MYLNLDKEELKKALLEMLRAAYNEGACGYEDLREDYIETMATEFLDKHPEPLPVVPVYAPPYFIPGSPPYPATDNLPNYITFNDVDIPSVIHVQHPPMPSEIRINMPTVFRQRLEQPDYVPDYVQYPMGPITISATVTPTVEGAKILSELVVAGFD